MNKFLKQNLKFEYKKIIKRKINYIKYVNIKLYNKYFKSYKYKGFCVKLKNNIIKIKNILKYNIILFLNKPNIYLNKY